MSCTCIPDPIVTAPATPSALPSCPSGYTAPTYYSLTVQESDGSPSYPNIGTLQFTATAFVLTQPGANIALVSLGYGLVGDIQATGLANAAGSSLKVARADHVHDMTVMVGSGSSSAKGAVPKPPTSSGTYLVLTEDATWSPPKIKARKGSGSDVGPRPRLSFIEGSNITITVADDAGNNEIDVTIAATSGGTTPNYPCQGRITTSSGNPTPGEFTLVTTLYWTPFKGDQIALYDGASAWTVLTFVETSFSVPATTDTNYDVFAYNNSGTLAIETVAWGSGTLRATDLVMQNGVYVKSGATTRRYLGTFRTTATSGNTEDSKDRRFVWNYHNRLQVMGFRKETTDSWTSSGNGTWAAMNGGASNWKFEFVYGIGEQNVNARIHLGVGQGAQFAVAIDGTTIDRNKTTIGGHNLSGIVNLVAEYENAISAGAGPAGYHYLQAVETSYSGSSATFYGDNGGTIGGGTLGINSAMITMTWK